MTIRDFIDKITISSQSYPTDIFSLSKRIYTCVNPYSYHIVRNNREVYSSMDGIFIDGFTMCLWIRILWKRKIPRLSFDMSGMAVDLFNRLNSQGNSENIFFIGATQEAIEKSVEQFREVYPQMKICGLRNGYFNNDEDRSSFIRKIIEYNPTFAIIGMGPPLQEKFAIDLKNAGYKGIAFTCGGFLHQSANKINYYPNWVNKYNLRAFYRLFHEKGLWSRLYNVVIEFPILFTIDSIKNKVGLEHNL